jgi:hypothetical protein
MPHRRGPDHGNATSSWFAALRIFYDSAATRPAFERESGGSWRPAG